MWSSGLRLLGGSLLTFSLVWALVLGWWQSNDHVPSHLDLGLYLAALPLALVGGFLLLRGFIDHLKKPPEMSPTPQSGLRDEDPLALATAKTAAAERAFTLGLVDAFIVTAGGDTVDDTLAALADGKRPAPSSRLTDDSGFPVFVAEVADLDVDTLIDSFIEESAASRAFVDCGEVMRAVALAERVLETSSERLRDLLGQVGDKASLRVDWLVPAAWMELGLAPLQAWLRGRLSNKLPEEGLTITLQPATHELDALQALDEVILQANRDTHPSEIRLLLGASSAVDEQTVARWETENRLFSAQHQQRQIPGEGAVALILAGPELIERLDLADGVRVSRLNTARRDKPVDAGGRIGGKLIEQLVTGLLDLTGTEPAAIKAVLLDTDHRASYLTEALEGLGPHGEHLDPIQDCLALGTLAGSLLPIGSLVALACARSKVLASEAPVLCISNQHPVERGALLVMPFALNPDIQSSST
jgi:hypothetical protein